MSRESALSWIGGSASSHSDTLILPAFAADAAANVGGIGAVLEVVATGCRLCGFQLI
jgi:hypothetical protein